MINIATMLSEGAVLAKNSVVMIRKKLYMDRYTDMRSCRWNRYRDT